MICIGRDRYDDYNYDLQLVSSDKYTDKISDALTINQMYTEECHGELPSHHITTLSICTCFCSNTIEISIKVLSYMKVGATYGISNPKLPLMDCYLKTF